MKEKSIFQNVEKKTGVKLWEILKLANSVQHVNFKDEESVRSLIKKVGVIANKPVNKETEDQIVKTIINDTQSLNYKTISKMMDKK